MAGFKTENDTGLISDINVTPFVDVSLVLLIIFMSTSVVIVRTALDLDIPVASNAARQNEPPVFSVLLTEDNALALNGEPTDRDGLRRSLAAAVRKASRAGQKGGAESVQVLISARGDHAYQSVVDLIDLMKGCGVGAVALNTRVPPAETNAPNDRKQR